MQWIPSDQVDKTAWDLRVREWGGSVFSLSGYFDAVADHWGVLWNDDHSGGIACPFTVKLGVKTLYAPFFHRYIEWIGETPPSREQLEAALKEHFPVAEAQLNGFNSAKNGPDKCYQLLHKEDYSPNQQASRMLKKAVVFEVGQEIAFAPLLKLLKEELSPRVTTIDDRSLGLLEDLLKVFSADKLIQLNLFESGEWKGGIWLLNSNGRLLYLKGTVRESAKKKGGMYRLMNEAIQLAWKENLLFDFGGSNVEGVRRFNLNWGSMDVFYYRLHWNNAPLWWKMIKYLRSKWKKKSY